tara:strand:+ start:1253 stop:1549 length:297 start_codon:yes stop_codon:yes gene_type:complete
MEDLIMQKIGEMFNGASGSYLICKVVPIIGHKKFAVHYTASNFDFTELDKPTHFYFKKDAIDFIDKKETEFLNSEPYLQSQVDSGLLSKEEMLERLNK